MPNRKNMHRAPGFICLSLLPLSLLVVACTQGASVPADIPALVNRSPCTLERANPTPGPSAQEIEGFSRDFTAFFAQTGTFQWLNRTSQGLPEDNRWGQPGYKVWWTNAHATKTGDLVTIDWDAPPDNTTAKISRALSPLVGLHLSTGDPTTRDLVLGYMRGLSACYQGMIWGDEDPVVEGLMARCIFHRNYETTVDGGRRIAVHYDTVRVPVIERRHDTLHNPHNPTWGDIYVRNKRSKDDLPYLYRNVPWLIRLIHEGRDPDLRAAAILLYRQIRAMCVDVLAHDYCIRTKDGQGRPFIPTSDSGQVDDFATFTAYDDLFPLAECTAKLGTALIARGETLGNTCLDASVDYYGHGGGYEEVALASHFWSTNMIWGFHLTALALAQSLGAHDVAQDLMEGLAARIDELKADPRAEQYSQWRPDLAQLLVQAAAYGLPLTGDEARLIQEQYLAAAAFYRRTVTWDPWDDSAPEGVAFPLLPPRDEMDEQGDIIRSYVRPTEILNPFEYCASPLRSSQGARFIDCEQLMDPRAWGG